MSARRVTECGLCGNTGLDLVLSLGASPPTCAMAPAGARPATEEHHPLELLSCPECTLVQLSVIVDPAVSYPAEYPYQSGNSRQLHGEFEALARRVAPHRGDLVVDIGANDGTLLSKFEPYDCRTIGVEPTGQAEHIEGPAYREFFSEALAARIVDEHGQANVVTACNVLAHVSDLEDTMRGIRRLLGPDGVLVAENHDIGSVLDGQWDTVYHEHLRYWSVYSFARLLDRHGFGARWWEYTSSHGGSFRVATSPGRGPELRDDQKPSHDFAALAEVARLDRVALREAPCGGKLWGIGATARATTIINYCGLDADDIECVCEVSGSDKIGRYIPGTGIPVVDEQCLIDDQPPDALVLSWHLMDSIAPALAARGYHGTLVPALGRVPV